MQPEMPPTETHDGELPELQPAPGRFCNIQPWLRNEWWVCFLLTPIVVLSAHLWARDSLPLATLFGMLLAVTSGTVLVVPVHCFMRWRAGIPWRTCEPKTSNIVGWVERVFVFSACALHNGPIVIAGWIALRSISHWKAWDEAAAKCSTDEDFGKGRARFNMFCVGTALSIMAAVGSAVFALWLYKPDDVPKLLTYGVRIAQRQTKAP